MSGPPRHRRRGRRGWPRQRPEHGERPSWRQGFGCLFALLFLIVAGSLVAVAATVVSQFGPVAGIIVGLFVLGALFSVARGLRGTGTVLDDIVEATGKVQEGDYSVRVATPNDGIRNLHRMVDGFNTMTARLEADEAVRRALLADVSHELRTPLTIIAGNLEALIDGVYPAAEAHIAPILDQTRVMERLIDDLRTLTLSEAGTLALHREPTAIDLLIAETVHSFGATATAAGIALTDATTGDLPTLEVDPVRIGEVLSNLVGNALRHTPTGSTVTVTGSHSPDARLVTVRVSDTGPGIAPELLPHVFDRFVKSEDSHGSGLGLAIARGLVEAHGGQISVTSMLGQGATFRVDLPTGT